MTAKSVIYQSVRMQTLLEQAKRYARSSASVLISGESGTGKELLAEHIHRSSQRAEQPFIALNCAALPRELVESELFGHEPGAFTGAAGRRQGRFELADRGTLFLDEIGELAREAQPKLLRVLETGEFQRVGGAGALRSDVRLVAATNRDLDREIRHGEFRSDLYHRLGVLLLKIPALRERREDIPALVQHFVSQFAKESPHAVRGVSPGVMRQLHAFDWPGNIRQLRNVLHRACILADGPLIELVELESDKADSDDELTLPRELETLPLRDIEQRVILHRLQLFDGNRSRTAETLGVTTRTLRNKLTEYRGACDAA
ncbi:MAG: sigma-54 interaction domain-containing protein [Planctomycetaceae bacterium]